MAAMPGGTKYSPLDQINASNVNKLQIAWRWKTSSLGQAPDYNWQATPLMIGDTLYFTAGSNRSAVAIDAVKRRHQVDLHASMKVTAADAPCAITIAGWLTGPMVQAMAGSF